jgi:hypothetical protein
MLRILFNPTFIGDSKEKAPPFGEAYWKQFEQRCLYETILKKLRIRNLFFLS